MRATGCVVLAGVVLAGAARADDAGIDEALRLLKQARENLAALELAEAEKSMTAALAKQPRLAAAYFARARLRVELGRTQDAARDAERASRLGENLWRWAGELYAHGAAYDDEARTREEAWKRERMTTDLVAVARARANAAEYEKSLCAYNEILRRTKGTKSVQHLCDRARVKSLLGNHEAALADTESASKIVERWSLPYQVRGRIKLRMGRIKEGLDDYKAALQKLPRSASSYFRLGLAYYDTGNWDDAIWALERAMSMDADHREYAYLYLFLARCRTGVPAKRMQAARELLKHLESREPEGDWFSFVGGYLTGSIEAEALLAEARKGTPHRQREQLCEAHAYIGARLMIAGDTLGARKRFRMAVDTNVGSFMEYNTADAELRRAARR